MVYLDGHNNHVYYNIITHVHTDMNKAKVHVQASEQEVDTLTRHIQQCKWWEGTGGFVIYTCT